MYSNFARKEESKIGLPEGLFASRAIKTLKSGNFNTESLQLLQRIEKHLKDAKDGLFSLTFLGNSDLTQYKIASQVLQELGKKQSTAGKDLLALENEVKEAIKRKSIKPENAKLLLEYYKKMQEIQIRNSSKFNIQKSDLPYTRM